MRGLGLPQRISKRKQAKQWRRLWSGGSGLVAQCTTSSPSETAGATSPTSKFAAYCSGCTLGCHRARSCLLPRCSSSASRVTSRGGLPHGNLTAYAPSPLKLQCAGSDRAPCGVDRHGCAAAAATAATAHAVGGARCSPLALDCAAGYMINGIPASIYPVLVNAPIPAPQPAAPAQQPAPGPAPRPASAPAQQPARGPAPRPVPAPAPQPAALLAGEPAPGLPDMGHNSQSAALVTAVLAGLAAFALWRFQAMRG